jgi:hypothetical protein
MEGTWKALFETSGAGDIAHLLRLGLALVALGLAAAFAGYAASRRALLGLLDPRPGRGLERERRALRRVSNDAFQGVLGEGEELRGVVLVDEPAARRPRLMVFLGFLLVTFIGAACVVNSAALMASGHVWVEKILVVAYGLLPLLALLLAAFVPGDLLLLTVGLALSLGWWFPIGLVTGTAPWAMSGDMSVVAVHPMVPPLWGAAAVLGSWLVLRCKQRSQRVLLVTTRGLRVVEAEATRARALGGVHRPGALTSAPGSYYRRWYFTEGEGDALEVHPFADDPDAFLTTCKGAGLAIELRTPARGLALPRELRELSWRLPVIPVLLVVALGLVHQVTELGLYLGLRVITEIATSMETRTGAERMMANCRETLEVHPESLTAWCFLALMQHTAGDYEAAEASLVSAEAVVQGAHFPKLLERGETHRLLTQMRENLGNLGEEGTIERKPPPPGWAPPGPDGERFQVIVERALGVRQHMWVSHWPEDVGELLAMAGRHPEAAGPAWLGALLAYEEYAPKKARAMLVAAGVSPASLPPELPERPLGDGSVAGLLGEVSRGLGGDKDLAVFHSEVQLGAALRDLVTARLQGLEEVSAWRGSAARLGGRLPSGLCAGKSDALATMGEPATKEERALVREASRILEGAEVLRSLGEMGTEAEQRRRLALDPPHDLAGLVERWTELGEP